MSALAPLEGSTAALSRPSRGRAITLAVGALALLIGVSEVAVRFTPSTWIQRDGRFYVNMNTTLVEDASLEQPFAASWYSGTLGWNRNLDQAWSNIALGSDGRHLPKHPILLPLLSTPLFWAFGLRGTLLYNLMLFALFGGAAFAFARRFASPPAALVATLGVLGATSIRDYAYDYHVDVTMLALFTAGLALSLSRRGMLAGVLFGATVALRPTMLLFMPFVALLLVGRRQLRTLGWVLLGGAIPVGLYALSNHLLYGAPWWTGYNRVLVVIDGVPQIHAHTDAFGVPLERGLETLFSGPFGIKHRLPFVFLAAPGLMLLLRRRFVYAVSAASAAAAAVFVFAQYEYYGDRFLWPAVALLLPALATTFDALPRSLARWPDVARPAVVALGAIALMGVAAAVGAPLEARFGDAPYEHLALVGIGVAAFAFGLSRLGERTLGSPLGAALPLLVLLLPGVRDRVLLGEADLALGAALALALGSRRRVVTLAFLAAAGGVVAYAAAPAQPIGFSGPSARPMLMLGALGLLGLPLLGKRAILLTPLLLLALGPVRGLGGGTLPLFAYGLVALPALLLLDRSASALRARWATASTRTRLGAALAPLLALGLIGAVSRSIEEPFAMASERGVRDARVTLGDDIPCDFLAWEHMNWECSTFDRSVHGQVGLATSQPITVGGEVSPLLLVSTTAGRSRSVRWDDVAIGEALALRYAIPDDARPTGTLVIRVGEQETAIALSEVTPAEVHTLRVDTHEQAGARAPIELTLSGGGAAVAVDGSVLGAAER